MRALLLLGVAWAGIASAAPVTVTVDAHPAAVLSHFDPAQALGAGVDGVPYPSVPWIYTRPNVTKLLEAGLGPVSYRLYTELSVQDWHWNPAGTFSEGNQGYWLSSATPGTPTLNTFGYRLPMRGFTHDQGNDDDYSRLDDGDPATYWKSNPYLTARYTHEPDALHPQWVLYDLGQGRPVNAARIAWAEPHAVVYRVQYWSGADAIYAPAQGRWVDFPHGVITNGAGGTVTLALGAAPAPVEYLRVLMQASSNGCDTHAARDPRNCVGYAIGEAGFGTLDSAGRFTDFVVHAPNQTQTTTYASSVDPWHAATNRVRNQEQPGLDVVFQSGITRGLPATVPVPMLYSTPENAAAEIAYLERRGYALARVELGEEPDGQYVGPEDDAALYGQFADAIHAVDPTLKLVGPVFQSNLGDVKTWPDARGETSWTRRYLEYLAAHGHIGDLNYFSFEHYPFNACKLGAVQDNLLREPGLVSHIVHVWREAGVRVPLLITETNYSQKETDASAEPAGAIWLADLAGTLLGTAGDQAGLYLYEYEPYPLSPAYPCRGWGTYGIRLGNQHFRAGAPLAQFFAAQMLTQNWSASGQRNALYSATVAHDQGMVGAYPVERASGTWALLLVNRDLAAAHQASIAFATDAGVRYFTGPVHRTTFGAAEYRWVLDGAHSHPSPDGPAKHAIIQATPATLFDLPQASITVLEGRLSDR